MEKENTKRNLQFQRNFKTNKFNCEDGLFEERRFQSTFWSQFNKDPDCSAKRTLERYKSLKGPKVFQRRNRVSHAAPINLHSSAADMPQSLSTAKGVHKSCDRKSVTFWERERRARLTEKLQEVLEII
jgi:hypothetical protein